MIEQGLQVCFNLDGCYVEDYKNDCRLIAKGKRLGRMFTLDVSMLEVKAAMFAHRAGNVADVGIWHKRIGHVNEHRLRSMQSKEIVTGLPKFKVDGGRSKFPILVGMGIKTTHRNAYTDISITVNPKRSNSASA